MLYKKIEGFTLLELVIVITIILILAGMMVPLTIQHIDEAKIQRTIEDTRSLFIATARFHINTNLWPGELENRDYLVGNGKSPGGDNSMELGLSGLISDYLQKNTFDYPGWNGPYINRIDPDEWESWYILRYKKLFRKEVAESAWIISAGPDADMQTIPSDIEVKGDDIGNILR